MSDEVFRIAFHDFKGIFLQNYQLFYLQVTFYLRQSWSANIKIEVFLFIFFSHPFLKSQICCSFQKTSAYMPLGTEEHQNLFYCNERDNTLITHICCANNLCANYVCAKLVCAKLVCAKCVCANYVCAKLVCAKLVCAKCVCAMCVCAKLVCDMCVCAMCLMTLVCLLHAQKKRFLKNNLIVLNYVQETVEICSLGTGLGSMR